MFLISFFFLLTHRSNPGGRFFAWELCACVCVCASVAANKHTWQQKTIRLLEEEKRGPHPYRLSQKNTGEDDICFLFFLCFLYLFRKSFCLPCEGMPLPQFQNMWLASAWLYFLRPPLPPPPAAALCPSGPVPQHRPIGREVRLGSAAPPPPVRTRAVVGSVHFSCSLF